MSVEPTSIQLFEEYCAQGSAKFVTALERIKGACDAVAATGGPLNYSQVGKAAVQLYGGPKPQSILNSPKHKAYIDARRQEQIAGSSPSSRKSLMPSGKAAYPTDGLDYKTKRYIDDLRQRNETLEAAMRELKRQVLLATEARPMDLAVMIGSGPETDAAMKIAQVAPPPLSDDARAAIKVILDDLPRTLPGVEVYRERALRLRTGEWLLNPKQYMALRDLLGESN
jgi:hypothetical protein